MTRKDDFDLICSLGGLKVLERFDGWPGLAEVQDPVSLITRRFSVHAAPVSNHRRSNADEVKIESPGKKRPVSIVRGALPVVLGHRVVDLDDGRKKPLIIGFPGHTRVGDNARWNQTFFKPFLMEAALTGWAKYERRLEGNGTITLRAFAPELLVNYLSLLGEGETATRDSVILSSLEQSGFQEDLSHLQRVRATRTALVWVRKYNFSELQKAAYGGACAMCGMTLGLVEGAHIYPVEAGYWSDVVSNGICACRHHHRAFDDHRIYIDPVTMAIQLHPSMLAEQGRGRADSSFVSNTFEFLARPTSSSDEPNPAWLHKRYEYFSGKYDWARAA